MVSSYDVVVIGAGHNGLVAGFYLARGGLRTLILERRSAVGGAAITEDICPGYRASTLAHVLRGLLPEIARDLALERRGVTPLRPAVRAMAVPAEGPALILYEDAPRTTEGLAARSARDAAAYPEFVATLQRLRPLLAALAGTLPPSFDRPDARALWALLKIGRRFRRLSRADAYRLLRWGPMPVADLVAEWFEDDLLRALVAAPALFGALAGPWSAGTGARLLIGSALDAWAPFVRGGAGALTEAMAGAARDAGAAIRLDAGVARVLVHNAAVSGVELIDGTTIAAHIVVSDADPRRTFLTLIDPLELDPAFSAGIRNYRCEGAGAKINLALDALPDFRALGAMDLHQRREALSGEIHVGPTIAYLERAFDAAKYGEVSASPYLSLTIPSITDPSLAPPGKHVMSICMQYAPYHLRRSDWTSRRDELADTVLKTIAEYAPGLPESVVSRQVITPLDLEQRYALTGGHIHHGEPSLDQLFAMRPVLGWGGYRTPIRGLYLCGAGTHPGGGVTGAPGRLAARRILRDRAF